MTDWDLEPPPPKKSTSPDKPRGGSAAGGSAGAGSHSDTTPRSAPDTTKAFSGAIIMPDTAKRPEAVGLEAPPVEPPSEEPAETPAVSARRRRAARNLAGWIVAALALILVGALVGFFVARSQSDQMEADLAQAREQLGLAQRALAQSEERNWNYYRENQALEAALEAQAGDPPSTSTTEGTGGGFLSHPAVHFPETYADGVFLVGEDIAPGAYDGVVVGEQGYWARLKGTDGLVGQIIANGVPRGPFVLTIVASDKAVELRGVRLTAR